MEPAIKREKMIPCTKSGKVLEITSCMKRHTEAGDLGGHPCMTSALRKGYYPQRHGKSSENQSQVVQNRKNGCRHRLWMVPWRSTLNQGTCQNFGPLKKLRHELRERQIPLLKLFGSNLGSELLEDCRTFPLMMTTFGCQLLSSPGWIGFERMEGKNAWNGRLLCESSAACEMCWPYFSNARGKSRPHQW